MIRPLGGEKEFPQPGRRLRFSTGMIRPTNDLPNTDKSYAQLKLLEKRKKSTNKLIRDPFLQNLLNDNCLIKRTENNIASEN